MASAQINLMGKLTLLGAALHIVMGLYAFGIVLPFIAADFKDVPGSALLSQLVGGITGLAFAIGSFRVGGLIERFGYARVYLWSSVVFAVAGTSAMLLDNLYLILATRVIVGFAVAGALVASITGISTLPARDRARLLGLQTVFAGVIALALFYLVAQLTAIGWRIPFALHLIGLAFVPFILALPRGQSMAGAGGETGAEPVAPAILPTASFLLLTLFIGMIGVLPALFAPFYLAGIGITDPAQVMLPLMASGIAVMPAAASYGWVQARIGINGVFALCLIVAAAGAGMAGFTANAIQLSVAIAVMCFGLGYSPPNLNAAAVAASPLNPGRSIGIVNGIFYGSQAFLPFASTALVQLFGGSGVFMAFALVSLAWGMVFLIGALRARPPEEAVAG